MGWRVMGGAWTSTVGLVAVRPMELGNDEGWDCFAAPCDRKPVSFVLRLLSIFGGSTPTPIPRRAMRTFILPPPVTDTGRSKSKLPCFVRLALMAADADESFVELFLLVPLPLPLATFCRGTTACAILDSILDSLSLSLIVGDPTRLGCVISTSARFLLSSLSFACCDLS